MKNICIVTGGGSGMGLEAAKLIGKEQKIILVGRTVSKLEKAMADLTALGIETEAFSADVSNRKSVEELAKYASAQGPIKTIINAAGVSPHMADAKKIFTINAVGPINITEVFAPLMSTGGCILHVSSMSAYMLPSGSIPVQVYELSLDGVDKFLAGAKRMIESIPTEVQSGSAYTISKNFLIWYTARMAVKYGKSGLRIVSISPGTFATPMGEIEGENAAKFALEGALGRLGQPEEIARMMAFMVSDECSYLTGVDILYDGGSIAAFQAKKS